MKHRDIEGLSRNRLNKLGSRLSSLFGRPKNDLSLIYRRHAQEPLLAIGDASGLEQGGEGGGLFGQILELFHVEVVEHHVDAQDVLDLVNGFPGETSNGSVVDGEDCDGSAAVD